MNWLKCLLGRHDWKVRYLACNNVDDALKSVGELRPDDPNEGCAAPITRCKRRAILCDRCGKELKVK